MMIHRLIVPGAVAGILALVVALLSHIIRRFDPLMTRKRHPWRGALVVLVLFALVVVNILVLARAWKGH